MTRLRSLIKEVLSTPPKKKDCNCGCGGCDKKAPIITEGRIKKAISEGLTYHVENKIPLHESVYRIGSEKHFALINEARKLWVRGLIDVSEDDQAILETHLGNFGMYEGEKVPLDMPMVNEEKKLTYNDFVRMVRDDMMAGAAPDEKPSDKQVASRAKSLYNDYLQGASVDDLFEESLNEEKELKKGDKLKLKLKNGKEFEVTFDSYSKTDGIGYMKYIDKDGDPVRGTFSLNSIVSEGNKSFNFPMEFKLEKDINYDSWGVHEDKLYKGTFVKDLILSDHKRAIYVNHEGKQEVTLDQDDIRNLERLGVMIINEGFKDYLGYSDHTRSNSGLNVIPKDQIHANKLKDAIEDSGMYAEWNTREGYFFFPEEEDGYDQLEMDIQDLMDENNIQGYIEGVFEESLNEQMDIYDEIANEEFGMDYDQLGSNEKEWVRDEIDNMSFRESLNEEDKKWSSYEQRMVNQIKAAQREGRGMYTLPMKTQDFYFKHKDKFELKESVNENLMAKFQDALNDDQFAFFQRSLDKAERGEELNQSEEQVVKYFGMVKAKYDDAIAKGISPDEISLNPNKPIDEAEFKGKDVALNKPKRGGSKAYYVYVRDPKTKKIKKVSFGSGGLRAKIKNKEARNAFAARHNCKNKKDRTKAGYWSCNLPRYAKQLGLGANMNTFW